LAVCISARHTALCLPLQVPTAGTSHGAGFKETDDFRLATILLDT
jgi:hypothetical protein